MRRSLAADGVNRQRLVVKPEVARRSKGVV